MKNIKLLVCFILFCCIGTLVFIKQPSHFEKLLSQGKLSKEQLGKIAKEHLVNITERIGGRTYGSKQEKEAAKYIQQVCAKMGYTSQITPFKGKLVTYHSQNVIATKKGKSKRTIIIGAHYDSTGRPCLPNEMKQAKGVADDGVGVTTLLETMYWLKDVETPYTLQFMFFGGEEFRMEGSYGYVKEMSQEQKHNVVFMINVDGMVDGDYNYIHNGDNGLGEKYREKMIELSDKLGLDFKVQQGKNRCYPKGESAMLSDHESFEEVGIPVVIFEASNYEIPPYDGNVFPLIKTGERVDIIHSKYDNLTYIEENLPGRIDAKFKSTIMILGETLLQNDF